MKKYFFLFTIIVSAFYSCKKETPHTDPRVIDVDVFVSGYVSDYGDSYYDVGYPTYWKNGNPVVLDSNYYYAGESALSIAVAGNNVYAVGYGIGTDFGFREFAYSTSWKNGLPVDIAGPGNSLTGNIYQLSSLAVSNNDIYMVASGSADNASYIKNGSVIVVSNGSEASEASSIAVSGTDVYVAGISFNRNYYNGGYNRMAKYWKNGDATKLTDGTKDAIATAIAISGTNVYVAGSEKEGSVYVAKYWNNGKPVNLTDGLTAADANSIAVSGTDVYVAGSQWDGMSTGNGDRVSIAKYWKNGEPVNLTDGSKWAEAKSIAVSGNDVYIAGFEESEAGSGNYVAKYWKNGRPVILGDVSKNSKAYSIFLAPK
jgi:hypothetical protein